MKYLLLVDDDIDDQDIFKTALAEVAHTVAFATASNGEEALQQLNSDTVYPDLIFLDINMPILNGFETLIQIKNQDRLRHIPVIIYSTTVRPEDIEKAIRLGAADCIKKPSGFLDVCNFITRLLNQDA